MSNKNAMEILSPFLIISPSLLPLHYHPTLYDFDFLIVSEILNFIIPFASPLEIEKEEKQVRGNGEVRRKEETRGCKEKYVLWLI